MQDDLFLLREKDPELLIIAFVSSLEVLAEKTKLQMRNKFQEIENEDECVEDVEEDDMSTQFLRIQKNQLIDLKQHLELFVDTLQVFGSLAADTICTLLNFICFRTLYVIKKSNQQSIKKQLISIIQIWRCTVSRHNEVSWKGNNIRFVSESLQNN